MYRLFVLVTVCLSACLLSSCGNETRPTQAQYVYTVVSGDTLLQVSRVSHLSLQAIIQTNKLQTHRLHAGQRLLLSGVRPVVTQQAPAAHSPAHNTYETITRRQWSAAPIKSNFDRMNGVTRITLHHTSEIPGMMQRSDAEVVQSIARYHRGTRGWADIGYHYLIGRDGKVYEGRSITAQGAHAQGANNKHNLGVAVIGDFNNSMPNAKQLQTLSLFLAQQQKKYGIPSTQVFGHTHFSTTDCPGTQLKSWLDRYCQGH